MVHPPQIVGYRSQLPVTDTFPPGNILEQHQHTITEIVITKLTTKLIGNDLD
jgi:hypothetical protein